MSFLMLVAGLGVVQSRRDQPFVTSPEVRQNLVGLRDADPVLYEQHSAPSPSGPVPPPPEDNGTYPDDQEHNDNE